MEDDQIKITLKTTLTLTLQHRAALALVRGVVPLIFQHLVHLMMKATMKMAQEEQRPRKRYQ